jgi:hypothetical protein
MKARVVRCMQVAGMIHSNIIYGLPWTVHLTIHLDHKSSGRVGDLQFHNESATDAINNNTGYIKTWASNSEITWSFILVLIIV